MRSGSNNSYDFHCGNDSRFVRLAVKSNIFHTLRIQAEAARSINLTGGTRKVEEILIAKCFKLTRIHWPKYTGSITRLRIYLAESMTKLDLSGLALEGLLELSILDCAKLTNISGLPATLKWLNIQGATINNIDVSHCQHLEVFNVSTLSPTFTANLTHLPSLQSASIATTAEKTDGSKVTCQLEDCATLRLLNIQTGNIPASIDLKACPNLAKAAISCGHRSELHGLSACAKLEFFHSARPDIIKMDDASRRTLQQHSATSATHPDSIAAKDEMADINDTFTKFSKPILYPEPGPDDDETIIQLHGSPRERNHACMVRINLLSVPLEQQNERFSKAFTKKFIHPIESLPSYLGGTKCYIYYLDNTLKKKELEQLQQSSIIPTDNGDAITQWLENKSTKQPNTLMITAASLTQPSMIAFIKTYRPDKRLIVYNDNYYRLTPMHKIVAEESTRDIISNLLAVQPAAGGTIARNALAIQQRIAAAAPNLQPPVLSASNLQAQTNAFINQLAQTYDDYSNALVNTPSSDPSTTSSMRITPANSLALSNRPTQVNVRGSDKNDTLYSIPARPSAIRKTTTSTPPPWKSLHHENEPDPWKSRSNKEEPPPWKSLHDEDEPDPWKSRSDKKEPIPELSDRDQIKSASEEEMPDDWATHNRDNNEEPLAQARISSGAKAQTIDKSTGRTPQKSVITGDNDDTLLEPARAKAIASTDDNPDHWKSGSKEKKPTPDSIDDEAVPHARLASEAKPFQVSLTTSHPADRGVLTNDNDDMLLKSAKIAAKASQDSSGHARAGSMSINELPKPGHGILEPGKDDIDKILSSAKAKAAANQHQILFENLPTGQHGTLTEQQDEPDKPLASAKVNVEATGKPALTANAGSVNIPNSASRLLDASKQLAEAMQQMANIAKASVSSDDEPYDQLNDASEQIDDSLESLTVAASVTADLPAETAMRESLEAANNLADAVKRLNAACNQLQVVTENTSSLATTPRPAPAKKSTPVKSAQRAMTIRNGLIQTLTEIKDDFIQNHRDKKLSGGIFGTGFQAGKDNMRLEFLNTLLYALKNNQKLSDKDVDRYLKEIMNNPELKKALTPHESALKAHLTGSGESLADSRPPKLSE